MEKSKDNELQKEEESGVACQTDIIHTDMDKKHDEYQTLISSLHQEIADLSLQIQKLETSMERMSLSETALKNLEILKFCTEGIKLTKFKMVLMFLMKIRLNSVDEDLAFRFGVQSTMSRNFHKVLNVMHDRLSPLIMWPERGALMQTMPASFRKFFRKCAIIIDCFEVFMERPTDLLARAQVWSHYKHHSTVKFLIVITPQGTISFVSKAYGGQISDKEIVEKSDLIDYLEPGDVILADWGFNYGDYASLALAEVKTPQFTKGKCQLSKVEVDWSRELSIVRIHMERVIGVLKQKYTILQSVLPISLISDKSDQTLSTIDKIIRVFCALINLCPPIVPQD